MTDASRQGLNSPELEALFLEGLDVANRTGLAAKRRLLARVIAQAVTDEAKVEEAQLITLALRDLDAPHIRALVSAQASFNRVSAFLEAATRFRLAGSRNSVSHC